jgi:predicted RNA binding protein YcfA (HicA-like mRNA interferase family)
MAEYEKKVREILKQNGFVFFRRYKGDHDIWINESLNKKVTVDSKIKSRHMANQIMKEAGILYHF